MSAALRGPAIIELFAILIVVLAAFVAGNWIARRAGAHREATELPLQSFDIVSWILLLIIFFLMGSLITYAFLVLY